MLNQFIKLCFVLNLFVLNNLKADTVDKYFGVRSIEAMLNFEATALIYLPGQVSLSDLKATGPKAKKALLEVGRQLKFLMGSFQQSSFRTQFGHDAVPGEKWRIQFLDIQDVSEERGKGRKFVRYQYEGKVVVDTRSFSGSGNRSMAREIPIVLPLAYDLIYDLGVKDGINVCTDEHYNGEGDFFYFWDPEKRGCPLKKNNQDVLRLTGTVTKIPNTKLTYPEYDKLYGKKVLSVSVFLGYIDDVLDHKNPMMNDNGMIAFEEIDEALQKNGYQVVEKREAFRLNEEGESKKGINFWRYYNKKVKTALGNEVEVRVKMFLGDTSISSPDMTFHQYLIPSYEKDDIIIYDGHSGLGGNLALSNLPEFSFDSSLYQIIFFNGCSSYPYYNSTYFEAKGGSQFLDIVTSGLPTITNTMASNVLSFMLPFLKGKVDSWQKILKEVEKSNGENDTYLTGVNGDEDNQFVLNEF